MCSKRRFSILLGTLFILSFSAAAGYSADKNNYQANNYLQLTADEIAAMEKQLRETAMTTWFDPLGRQPITYRQWLDGQGKPSPFNVKTALNSDKLRTGAHMAIIVNADLYDDILASLNQYIADISNEGYVVDVHTTSGGTPEDFRAFLQGLYNDGMEGCVLIGDLPIPWYETECDVNGTMTHQEFPIDLFYMDLDGIFYDIDTDGLYDTHYGSKYPEIWMGRLTASPLSYNGANEVDLLINYFNKNHQYRTGVLTTNNRALVYVDDDWESSSVIWDVHVGLSYDTRTLINDGATTISTDYEGRLDDNYEAILLAAHSSPYGHSFKIGSQWTGGYTGYYDIINIDPTAIFYNLFACSNCSYVSSNYMGGWYIFCQDYGLAAVGSAKTGAMLNFNYFYGPFGNCASIGIAFKEWFSAVASGGMTEDEICWHYGMTLLGDPTLAKNNRQALEITSSTLPAGRKYDSYSTELAAEGSIPPYTWELVAGSLPPGLSLNQENGTISGTPDEYGVFNFTVSVFDACTFSSYSDTIQIDLEIHPPCGDANLDDMRNILDIVMLINYIYKSGPAPDPITIADVNSDEAINILDVVYLINFVYKSGPDPECP